MPFESTPAQQDLSTSNGGSKQTEMPDLHHDVSAPIVDDQNTQTTPQPSANTLRAYASDWRQFSGWCRRNGHAPLPPDTNIVALYIASLVAPSTASGRGPSSAATIERRISALTWNYAQRGQHFDRNADEIVAALSKLNANLPSPSHPKEAITSEELRAMLGTLDRGTLRGLRDCAMLLVGHAGGLRRAEIVALDAGPDQTDDGLGWIEFHGSALKITVRRKTGLFEIEIARGTSNIICPVATLESWLQLARITRGPIFRRVTGSGKRVGPERLRDQEVARLVKKAILASGIRSDLPEAERVKLFSAHSLRLGSTDLKRPK